MDSSDAVDNVLNQSEYMTENEQFQLNVQH